MSWIEKYRPKTLGEIVGQNKVTKYIEGVLANGRNLNHLIFYGKPGTGKTTTARVIAKELNLEIIEYNASNDRSLNFIREKIIPAMKYKPIFGDYKIIFLDEADSMTREALSGLRRPMELYEKNAKIIFSCNEDNIIDAIKSRCITFYFKPISSENIKNRLTYISKMENIDINDDTLNEIVSKSNGDLRRAINYLEAYSKDALEFQDEYSLIFK